VPVEAMHAVWFASSVEAVVAAVAMTTTGAASSAPATTCGVRMEMVHADVAGLVERP